MIIEKYHAYRGLSARSVVFSLLVSLLPAFIYAAIMLPRFLFANKLADWNRGIFQWVPSSPDAKIFVLISYTLALVTVFSVLAATILIFRYSDSLERRFGTFSYLKGLLPASIVGGAGVVGFVLFVVNRHYLSLGAFGVSLAAFGIICIDVLFRVKHKNALYKILAILAFLIGIAPLCYALIYTPFRVPNEFLSLPEVTLLSDGARIDNIDYINTKKFEGLQIPDPRVGYDASIPFVINLDITKDNDLAIIEEFINKETERFWYDPRSGRLEIHGPIKKSEYEFLYSFITRPKDKERLEEKYAKDTLAALKFTSNRYGKEELAFLRDNRPELERQLVLGRFFYHHVFLFLPALSGVLDGKVKSASQYGRGLTVFFSDILRLVPENIRFNVYLGLLYLSYPLYFALLLMVAAKLGFSRWWLIFIGGFTIFAYLTSEIETTRLGVGLAPWRHFIDGPALLVLFLYTRRPTLILGALLAGLLGLSIYWSREMGLFLSIGVVFALVAHALTIKERLTWLLVGGCFVSMIVGWRLGDPHAPGNLTVTLLGINTPGIPPGFIQALAGVLVIVGVAWLVLRPSIVDRMDLRYTDWILLGAVLGYVASSSIYLIWYPRPHHLAPTLPIIGLAIAVIYRCYIHRRNNYDEDIAKLGVVSILIIITLLGSFRSIEVRRESRIFKDHVVNQWKFPDGRMVSTGQPHLLSESISLIRRYESGSSVNIMSPWEVVLLPFSGKYKSGPYALSFDSLLSKVEVDRLAEFFVNSPSKILFVDSHIIRGEYELALSDSAYMSNRILASKLRIRANVSLRNVFYALRACYDLAEEGRLISVYERKDGAKWSGDECRIAPERKVNDLVAPGRSPGA